MTHSARALAGEAKVHPRPLMPGDMIVNQVTVWLYRGPGPNPDVLSGQEGDRFLQGEHALVVCTVDVWIWKRPQQKLLVLTASGSLGWTWDVRSKKVQL